MGPQTDRPDRHTRRNPVRPRPAQNPQRQDHAADFAQDCGERHRQSRRYFHAGRSGRSRRSARQPTDKLKERDMVTLTDLAPLLLRKSAAELTTEERNTLEAM